MSAYAVMGSLLQQQLECGQHSGSESLSKDASTMGPTEALLFHCYSFPHTINYHTAHAFDSLKWTVTKMGKNLGYHVGRAREITSLWSPFSQRVQVSSKCLGSSHSYSLGGACVCWNPKVLRSPSPFKPILGKIFLLPWTLSKLRFSVGILAPHP